MSEAERYTGSCHCGKVRYEVTAEIEQVMACNCSMCSRVGYLMTFVAPEQFQLLSGEEVLRDYQFNKHVVHHLFCSHCGVRSFGRGTNREGKALYCINVRCLEGVELDKLQVKHVDGKSL